MTDNNQTVLEVGVRGNTFQCQHGKWSYFLEFYMSGFDTERIDVDAHYNTREEALMALEKHAQQGVKVIREKWGDMVLSMESRGTVINDYDKTTH